LNPGRLLDAMDKLLTAELARMIGERRRIR